MISVIAWFTEEVARAARAAHAKMMRGDYSGDALYLYFKPGELRFAEERPEGFELGWPERAPGNLTADQLIGWTHERSRRLPCLPSETVLRAAMAK